VVHVEQPPRSVGQIEERLAVARNQIAVIIGDAKRWWRLRIREGDTASTKREASKEQPIGVLLI
jgi:hypothetical protein